MVLQSNVGEELFADLPVEQRRHALEEMTNTVQVVLIEDTVVALTFAQ